MILSLLGSIVGYILSTNSTRNRILDQQIEADQLRVVGALAAGENDVVSSAEALARTPGIIDALITKDILAIDRQALLVRERFQLDQVLILDNDGQALVNIVAQSYLSQIDPAERDRILTPANGRTVLLLIGDTWLLAGRATIFSPETSVSGQVATVYTFLNITEALERYRREIGLLSEIIVHPDAAQLISNGQSPGPAMLISRNGFRELTTHVQIGGWNLPLLVRRSETEINNILNSGLHVVLLSNGMTLVLVLLIGLFLARSFARPIRKLSWVAQSVAAGNLTARAKMVGHDEIGRLGEAFDKATSTISALLDQQARSVAETHAILQSIADGVLAIDADGQIIILNPAAAELLERADSDLLGRPLSALTTVYDPLRMAAMELIVDQVRSELTDVDFAPTEHNVAVGSRIVRLQSTPIRMADGSRAGAVLVLQDVTAVVEADRTKTEFIATASHELRTPLASLKGYIDLFRLIGDSGLSEQQREFLKVMKRQADHMTALVNDLLEMARVDRGAVRVNPAWVTIPAVFDEMLTSFQEQIRRREVQLDVEIADELPALWIDHQHLRRIVANLLSNAVKYVYQGGRIRVRVYELHGPAELPAVDDHPWPHDDQHSVVIEVEDNGVGIRLEDQAKIFRRFFRSENPLTVEAGGTGLGLAITRALVEHNKGQIGFRSVEGEGSCFWVRCPVVTSETLRSTTNDMRVVGSFSVPTS